ncbi:MAG: Membrane protein [Candidatus Magasanikbacteria bacterium GW2011_GWC2_37_14]|uniref:Membrane protein n=1 Tax=Candidatus Magasanikbacteria bacterium GW2011_GWC2_37_14 TaxID=1619046 RepID=A0A0G0GPS1_9BACT|nr:MAG: Membrane protein [Candidatus Magasanikbacteria bacterium GW2011_GWC2_37_14]
MTSKNRLLGMTVIIITNLIPLVGILFFNWNIKDIVPIYWLEMVILCFFNVLKVSRAEGKEIFGQGSLNGKPISSYKRSDLVWQSIITYSAFLFIYGISIMFVFKRYFFIFEYWWLIYVFMFEYWLEYYFDYLKQEKYKLISPADQYSKPIPKVIILHLVVFFGMFFMGNFYIGAIILILLKTVYELISKYRFKNIKIIGEA